MLRFVSRVGVLVLALSGAVDSVDAQSLWGITLDGELIRIDPGTGAGTLVGLLGLEISRAGADFSCDGELVGFSRSSINFDEGILYTVDLTSGAATVDQTFDLTGFPGNVGIEFGPDRETLYWIASGDLNVIDTASGVVRRVASLSIDASSLTLVPGEDQFIAADDLTFTLVRIAPSDGSVTTIGPTGIGSVRSLAAQPDGQLYGVSEENLYTFDMVTGAATLIGPVGFRPAGLAFGPENDCAGGGPQISKVSPNRGGNGGTITVTIRGKNFKEGALVRLMEGNAIALTGQNTVVASHRRILTTFDLRGQAPRSLTLEVRNPDGTSAVVPEGFAIEEGGAQVWVDIVGRSAIGAGREQTYTILYGNRGNVDTFDVILLIKVPAELEFKLNIPPPNIPGVEWERVPQGALVGAETVIPIWVYSVPAFSSRSFSLSVRAPLQGAELEVGAEVLQSEPTQFTQTGDFRFVAGSPIFFAVTIGYSFLHAAGLATMPVEDFADGLHTWLQTNQNEIRLVHYHFLSVAAATGVLGAPISDDGAIKLLSDPFSPTCCPDPFFGYGNYCGPGHDDLDGEGDFDEPPKTGADGQPDVLDAACKEHDKASVPPDVGGPGAVWGVLMAMCLPTPEQDKADDDICSSAKAFDPRTSYLVHLVGPVVGTATATEWKGLVMGIYCDQEDMPLGIPNLKTLLEIRFPALAQLCLATQVTDEILSQIVVSVDPNDKLGSQGSGPTRHLSGEEPLRYLIFFENVETATSPAQDVVITDHLDSEKMDLSTFRLGRIAFGNKEMVPPPDLTEFTAGVDLRPEKNLIVLIAARLDIDTGLLTWRFTSVDPDTHQRPEDPLLGFLPPNKNPPEGEGNVLFTVMPKQDLPTGIEVRNKASIIFDVNAPIDTPTWVNTLDNDKPQSRVESLPAAQTSTSFEVRWSGTDVGAGVKDFTIFVSEDDGPFTVWQRNTQATSGMFHGRRGRSYGFYSVARDMTGNYEDPPPVDDATTTTPANRQPVAHAGPDQVVECQGDSSSEVEMDGSASYDPDDDPLTFHWSANPSVSFSSQPRSPSASFHLGTTAVTLVVNDGTVDSTPDDAMITVQDTLSPVGGITGPPAGACFGPAALPAVVADNFTDQCDPNPSRSYDPGPGPTYSDHGDHNVALTATDSSGNSAQASVGFTIDIVPPLVEIIEPPDRRPFTSSTLPVSIIVRTSDDDGATGAVVHEILKLAGCTIYDGLSYGDGDGLLTDEVINLTQSELCRLSTICGFTQLNDPELRVEATDCGGNVGVDTHQFTGIMKLRPGICGKAKTRPTVAAHSERPALNLRR